MKVIEYKQTRQRYAGIPAISFSKMGVIRFNVPACRLLGLTAGDRVSFAQDADRPIDWYVKKDTEGPIVRRSPASYGLVCNFQEVAKQIRATVKKDFASMRLATIATDGMYAILTKSV